MRTFTLFAGATALTLLVGGCTTYWAPGPNAQGTLEQASAHCRLLARRLHQDPDYISSSNQVLNNIANVSAVVSSFAQDWTNEQDCMEELGWEQVRDDAPSPSKQYGRGGAEPSAVPPIASAAPAPTLTATPPTSPSGVRAQAFDGTWTGRDGCPAYGNMLAWSEVRAATIAQNHFRFERNSPMLYELTEGTVQPDGTITASGQGQRRDRPGRWTAQFSGKASATAMRLTGTRSGGRPCSMELSKLAEAGEKPADAERQRNAGRPATLPSPSPALAPVAAGAIPTSPPSPAAGSVSSGTSGETVLFPVTITNRYHPSSTVPVN